MRIVIFTDKQRRGFLGRLQTLIIEEENFNLNWESNPGHLAVLTTAQTIQVLEHLKTSLFWMT